MGMIIGCSMAILMVIVETIRLNRRERKEKEQEEEWMRQQQTMERK
jgi:MFS superfamily sulfate permease-like transporter